MQHTDLTVLLMNDNSRANTDFVGSFVRQKPELVHQLWEIYFSMQEPVSRRAAWIIDTISEQEPAWVVPHLNLLIDLLPQFSHDGLKRHGLRMIARNVIPDDRIAGLMNTCFEWLVSPDEAVAAKVYCMIILEAISEKLPEIRNELIDTIEFQMAEGSPGFRVVGKKMLAKLYKASIAASPDEH